MQIWGLLGVQKEAVLASTRSIVTVEEIVDELPPVPGAVVLPAWVVSAVCQVPGGAHPSFAMGFSVRDNAFYKAWDAISKDRDAFTAWIDKHVMGHRGLRRVLRKRRASDGASTPTDELMIVNAARQLGALAAPGKRQCFVGIGLPSTAANLARRLYPIEPVLIYESGCIGSKPTRLPLSIGDGELAETSDAVVSVPEIFAYWLQAGRIDVGFLGGAQLDKFANINSTVIGVVRVTEDPAAGCRWGARDRRFGGRGDGDHAPVGAGVRRALRLPHLDRLRRRQG